MALHADHLDPRPLAGPAQDRGRRGDVDAELRLAQPRRDVGVRAGVDVGVHAQRDSRARAARRGHGPEPPDLGLALGVPLPDSALEPERQLGVGLADTREDDPLRREARPQRREQLAAGHDVGAGAEPCQQPQDGAVAVGLDGVADAVRDRGEGARVGRVGRLDRRAAVNVERRAVLRGGGLQRHAVADELGAGPGEPAHARAPAAAGSPARASSSRSSRATTPDRPSTPIRFGKICKPFIRSPQAQTRSTRLVAPNTTSPQ